MTIKHMGEALSLEDSIRAIYPEATGKAVAMLIKAIEGKGDVYFRTLLPAAGLKTDSARMYRLIRAALNRRQRTP